MSDMSKINPIGAIRNIGNTAATEAIGKVGHPGRDFRSLLESELVEKSSLTFSKHARERVNQRQIELSDTLLDDLNKAVSKARDKGAKDVVVIGPGQAFIVNTLNNTVITTISGNEMKDNIFTNIDSAVIL